MADLAHAATSFAADDSRSYREAKGIPEIDLKSTTPHSFRSDTRDGSGVTVLCKHLSHIPAPLEYLVPRGYGVSIASEACRRWSWMRKESRNILRLPMPADPT